MDDSAYPVSYIAYAAGAARAESGLLPVEEAVTLYVNAKPWVTLMCTPALLDALALGFLFNEGFIRSLDDVAVLRPCGGGPLCGCLAALRRGDSRAACAHLRLLRWHHV